MLRFTMLALLALLANSNAAKAQTCVDPNGHTGVIIYNSTYDTFQGCTLRGWMAFNELGSGSASPSLNFGFTNVSNADFNALYESNIVAAAGLGGPVSLSISGQGNPQFRTCSASDCSTEIATWSASSKTVDDGDYVQIRMTSATLTGNTRRATLTDGSSVSVWDITTQGTADCGASPAPGVVCSDGTIYAGLTPAGNVPMYVTRCDLGMSWNGSACSGIATILPWNNGNNSGVTTTGASSLVDGELNTSSLLSIDSDSITPGIQPHQAAQACADLVMHGYNDWYLPSTSELRDVIYENLQDGTPNDNIPHPVVSGFSTNTYWASQEGGPTGATYVNFNSSFSSGNNKWVTLYFTRCARK